MSYRKELQITLDSPAASYWLKDALAQLDKRDPVDALADAQALVYLMQQRMEEINMRYLQTNSPF